ncbi:hypothetical protein DB347_19655 [Opitutaceae bacterium EW11]|nr:hypothetical protein DB347_19655 [Opitutaceae bacterium EW11]
MGALLSLAVFVSPSRISAAAVETANVMAPLRVGPGDWTVFEQQLDTVRQYGVTAVSVDVWMGEVEASGDNQFNWSYYDTIFSKIRQHHLKIVPILSFHQCGGNVGDQCDVPLPAWLWTKYVGRSYRGLTLDDKDLQFKSEQGNYCKESIQGWADDLVANEYSDFVTHFKTHFASYESDFIEIAVSAGPSGELRYPSYNGHDQNAGYPTRGSLQAYSRLAILDFREAVLRKYGSLTGVNSAWKTALVSTDQITPPMNREQFFQSGDYFRTQYGRDFVDWYNQSLRDHGKRLLTNVIASLGSSFSGAKISFKMPGVHWTMDHPNYPRAAEVAAGLIQTSVDFHSDATGHGYANIVGLARDLAASGRPIVLHFTCLEMDDDNNPPQYSQAKSLVFWVAQEAERQGVTIKGENALAGGVQSAHGWDNLENAFAYASYRGLTTLRIGEVAGGVGKDRFSAFIKRFCAPVSYPSMTIRGTHNSWATTPMTKTGTVWSVTNVLFGTSTNERFKFDVYGDWSQSYGGSGLSGAAVQGGPDIRVPGAGPYSIRFDEASLSYTVAASPASDTWYFRGTPNHWGTSPMTRVGGGDVFTLTTDFAREDPNPRFKIDHFGNWTESYPSEDVQVIDCSRYEIRFNRATKKVEAKRLGDVTTGTCASCPVAPGATYSSAATTFALWSPDTPNVQLWLEGTLYPMARVADAGGYTDLYAVTVPGDHHLKRYQFRVDNRVARDPYGVMVQPASDYNVVVNLALTDPAGGWAPRPALKEREDAVIYEIHIRDFTIDASAGVAPALRGKYLGMVQPGTSCNGKATGLDHLKEMGVTHVQILPFFDFQACSVSEPPTCYTWGYDPINFNVPEERYSVSGDPLERIRELKTMINQLHKAGIRVIMDVVYNHTAQIAGRETTFSPITPRYFFPNDLSGTGNAVDDRNPMVARFIRDSLEYWVKEYHVDGFRFDLMGIFTYADVGNWARYLNAKYPDATLLVYGEPWRCCGDDPYDGERVRLGTVGRIVDAQVGAFNSQFREALKGENKSGTGGGYIFNQRSDLFAIRAGSRGAIRFTYDPSSVLPNQWDQMFANDPAQDINYVSAHDDLVLRDKILAWAKVNGRLGDAAYLERIQRFAAGIILTSQGVPFLHGGDEMLREKGGSPNSYDQPDSVNAVRWQWKSDHSESVAYHKKLIALRRQHPGFRLTSWDKINTSVSTNETLRNGVVVTTINGAGAGDSWHDIIVIYNSADNYDYPLPDGTWFVALEKSDPNAGADRPVSGKVTAEGTAVTVLHR